MIKKANLKYIYLLLFIVAASFGVQNFSNAAETNKKKIEWIQFEDLDAKMKIEPRKIYIDVFTDWCHWCKVMDKNTLSNKNVVDYLNGNFYCIKLNAESKNDIMFQNKKYLYNKELKAHDLAIELLKGQLSFPTSIIIDEKLETPMAIPGYMDLKNMELILTYFGENHYKKTNWNQFQSSFKNSWK